MENTKEMEYINQHNGFMIHNGIKVLSITQEKAVAELTMEPYHCNTYGALHGGAYFTMCDCVAGALARSAGIRHVTLNGSINYIRAIKGGTVTATATVRHRGRSTCVVGVDVCDDQGRLVVESTYTMFAVGPMTEY